MGTGLSTLRERMSLCYGSDAKLTVVERPEGGVLSRIEVRTWMPHRSSWANRDRLHLPRSTTARAVGSWRTSLRGIRWGSVFRSKFLGFYRTRPALSDGVGDPPPPGGPNVRSGAMTTRAERGKRHALRASVPPAAPRRLIGLNQRCAARGGTSIETRWVQSTRSRRRTSQCCACARGFRKPFLLSI